MDKETLETVKGLFYMGVVASMAYGIYVGFLSLL